MSFVKHRNYLVIIFCAFIMSCDSSIPEYEGWNLIWHDEFNENGRPNTKLWTIEDGFSNSEQNHISKSSNIFCKNGLLSMEIPKEHFINVSSSKSSVLSVNTKKKFDFTYGCLEVKARLPFVPGVHSSISTFGNTREWPNCGQILLMDYFYISGEPYILAGATCGSSKKSPKCQNSKLNFSHFTDKDLDWGSKFHIWRMYWDQEKITIFLDDELLKTVSIRKMYNGENGDYVNPFKIPHYILFQFVLSSTKEMNLGSVLPVKYEIDYVRLYQKKKKPYTAFHPGKIWEDTDGKHINAHGGGILYSNGKYYFYGENKSEHVSSALVGVDVYSSVDLYNWENRGVALAVEPEFSNHPIEKGCIIERPKVIYNKKTGKYVMWFHLELKGFGYSSAKYGVAVSDNPEGPFKFLYASRSCPGKWPINMDESQIEKAKLTPVPNKLNKVERKKAIVNGAFLNRDFNTGQMSRDMTLFVDDDGKAYHIFSSENNQTIHIARLTDDYLYHDGVYSRVLPGEANEAPAIFKKDGVYWMVTSGCTGWKPNKARLFSTTNILGEWKSYSNPCIGPNQEKTFGAQSTFILPIEGKKDSWIFMADIWDPKNPINARYVWLPIDFDNKGVPVIKWQDEWSY